MRFNSKRDLWITLILIIISAYLVIMAFFITAPSYIRYMLFSLVSLIVWIYLYTYYIIDENYLVIRCGPVKIRILYEDIEHVKSTRNLISSMALSIDKVKIKTNKQGFSVIYISPKNKDMFINELKNKCNNLIIKD